MKCYDEPIQFISHKVEVRFLPRDTESVYFLWKKVCSVPSTAIARGMQGNKREQFKNDKGLQDRHGEYKVHFPFRRENAGLSSVSET